MDTQPPAPLKPPAAGRSPNVPRAWACFRNRLTVLQRDAGPAEPGDGLCENQCAITTLTKSPALEMRKAWSRGRESPARPPSCYGRVHRVGGTEPAIGLEVDPDGVPACACAVELAQRMTPLLYQRVGLSAAGRQRHWERPRALDQGVGPGAQRRAVQRLASRPASGGELRGGTPEQVPGQVRDELADGPVRSSSCVHG